MNYKLSLLLGLSTLILCLNACKKKSEDTPTPSAAELLTSTSAKTWQIEKLYINDTLVELTPEQLMFTKTYKSDSTFFDSDGIAGKYKLLGNNKKLEENITTGGMGTLYYDVEVLTAAQLVLKLTGDGMSTYNTKLYYRAK